MEKSISIFFENYANALRTFSAKEISGFYQTPMAVYSDQGVRAVNKDSEVLAFWTEGVKPYAAQKISSAIPTILHVDKLTNNIYMSKVKWKNYDESNNKVGEETNFYILTKFEDEIKISGLIIIQSN